MLTWVAAGHEAVPGNTRVGWNRGAEIAADAGLDQTCQVGHQPLIEVGLQNAPVRAVQSNNKHFADHGYPLRDLLTIRLRARASTRRSSGESPNSKMMPMYTIRSMAPLTAA